MHTIKIHTQEKNQMELIFLKEIRSKRDTRSNQHEAIKKKQNTTIPTNAGTYANQARGAQTENFEKMG